MLAKPDPVLVLKVVSKVPSGVIGVANAGEIMPPRKNIVTRALRIIFLGRIDVSFRRVELDMCIPNQSIASWVREAEKGEHRKSYKIGKMNREKSVAYPSFVFISRTVAA